MFISQVYLLRRQRIRSKKERRAPSARSARQQRHVYFSSLSFLLRILFGAGRQDALAAQRDFEAKKRDAHRVYAAPANSAIFISQVSLFLLRFLWGGAPRRLSRPKENSKQKREMRTECTQRPLTAPCSFLKSLFFLLRFLFGAGRQGALAAPKKNRSKKRDAHRVHAAPA